MPDKIKITMLGDASSGKTCYMLGMYAGMQEERHGFTLSTTDISKGIELNNLWAKLVNVQGNERWPSPTDQIYPYVFNFNYGYNPMIEFEWRDYRGGAISDPSKPNEVEELMKYILESSCLFLCVSGEHMQNKVEDRTNFMSQTKAKLMGEYLTRLKNNKDTSPFPVVITITKYDYCQKRKKAELIEEIKKTFSPLFAKKTGWLVMICAVSLGRNLATNENKKEEQVKIEPLNLHLPLVFALYSKFRESALAEKRQADETSERLEYLNGSNLFVKWWNHQEIENNKNKLHSSKEKFREMREKMKLLMQELKKADIYLNGEEIKIDM